MGNSQFRKISPAVYKFLNVDRVIIGKLSCSQMLQLTQGIFSTYICMSSSTERENCPYSDDPTLCPYKGRKN